MLDLSTLESINAARTLLHQAVETQGRDFVYNPGRQFSCFYRPKEGAHEAAQKTGCLIGTALQLAGRDLSGTGDGTNIFAIRDRFQLGDLVATYFLVAQKVQDAGYTWGQAYDAAERWLEAGASLVRATSAFSGGPAFVLPDEKLPTSI